MGAISGRIESQCNVINLAIDLGWCAFRCHGGTKIVTRREFGRIAAATALTAVLGRKGEVDAAPLPKLPKMPESEALLLLPSDLRYARYQLAYNKRTMLQPALRAVCRTPSAVGTMIDWVRSNGLPFSIRSGGHSFEGLSESTSVVIDTREMMDIAIDPTTDRISVDAGSSLGAIYKFLAPRGLLLPAGSCPTVGIAGHALGGGYGFQARALGLCCDSLLAVDLIDAQAKRVTVGPADNGDLFWACRGGGGGSFGAATRFTFQVYRQPTVVVFDISWLLHPDRGHRLFKVWQSWAPNAPAGITATMAIRRSNDLLFFRCGGLSTGTRTQLVTELKTLLDVEMPSRSFTLEEVPLQRAIDTCSDGCQYPSMYLKGKSDMILAPLSDDGIAKLLEGVLSLVGEKFYAICDPYGGAISQVAKEDTAFPYRKGTLYCIQYHTSWVEGSLSAERLAEIRRFYASLRPYMSGAAYVNYCDLDLVEWQTAYWGANLPRLSRVKAAFDPENIFRHEQGVLPF